ncbi:MAG: SGNH/GDSL hydrolase family protein [Kamptonema sp. SIO4C4]|nr:SGNH/GDSL hydrolase family protein [Kamptonema sp. SIO4C4]
MKLKPWQQNLCLVGMGVLSGLLLFELGLRVVGYAYPRFYQGDELRGRVHRPGASGWWQQEGEAFVSINAQGLRDQAYAQSNPPNTYRIAVLGDSFASAFQVEQEKTFWAIAEQQLANCPHLPQDNLEVINFGVAGYGTAQELLTLREQVQDYQPDFVLLAFLTGNDIRNNSPALEWDQVRPFFIPQGEEFVLDTSFRQDVLFKINQAKEYLRLGHLLAQTIDSISLRQHNPSNLEQQAKTLIEPGIDEEVYQPPTTPEWQKAWQVTEQLINQMVQEVKAQGQEFLLVTLSNGSQVYPDPQRRDTLKERLGVKDLFYPERRLTELSKQQGFRILTLAPRLQTDAQNQQQFLHGFANTAWGIGHWNENGHRLAGKYISEKICQVFKGLDNG